VMGNAKRKGKRAGRRAKPPLFLASGADAMLESGTGRDFLSIGTLSFSDDFETDGDWQLSVPTFLKVLGDAARSARRPRLDIIVVAGRTLRSTPRAHDVLAASDGVPVLFESLNGGGYRLAAGALGKASLVTIRERQLVVDHEHARPRHLRQRRLVELIASGAGVVRIDGVTSSSSSAARTMQSTTPTRDP
jgi:hypothetical protein